MFNDSQNSNSSLLGSETHPVSDVINLPRLGELAGGALRWCARITMLVTLLIAAYQAFSVFLQIGVLLRDPGAAESAVETVARLIEAEKLAFSHFNDRIKIRRLVSVLVLGFGYLLWASIPLWIIGTAARVLKSLQSPPN